VIIRFPAFHFSSMRSTIVRRLCGFILLLWCLSPAGAQTKPFVHPLFSNDMVLQRDALAPVWGWTTPGAQVSVTVNGQTKATIAGAEGRWQVAVGPFSAGGPHTLRVEGPQSVTFTNILFGDVFLVSGQSNIDWPVSYSYNANVEQTDSVNYPNIRVFTVAKTVTNSPQESIPGTVWKVPANGVTNNFSATAYFTARELYKQKGVPVGMLVSSWGATQIQSWVDAGFASSVADFTQALYDQSSTDPSRDGISTIYNAMIAPLAPFRLCAAIWYQGESNSGRGQQYGRLLPGLMSGWRSLFGQPDLPFLIVQLPNNDAPQSMPVESNKFMEVREAQLNTVLNDIGRSRIVNTIDLGEGVLHPLNKQDVGLRISWAARDLLYGDNIVSQGPILTQATPSGNAMLCTFINVGAGLMAGAKNAATPLSPVTQVAGTSVKGFALAGADHVFHFANATITGTNTISVTSPDVGTPVYVRYAWANNPVCNLYAKITDGSGSVINGIPAGSLRNDPVFKLSTNAATGGTETYTPDTQRTISATVPVGQVFHHWGGDTDTLAGSGSIVTSTITRPYVSLRAYFRITAAPTVTVWAQVGQNVVEWTPLDSAQYNVKRGTAPNGPFTTIAGNVLGPTRYADTQSADGVTYHYTVSAVNEVGEGPDATTVAATTVPYVHGLTATAGIAQVALSWNAFSGNALSYSVHRSTVPGGPYQTIARGIAGLNHVDHAVVAGSSYYYVVSALTAGGETPVSPEAGAGPLFLPPPLKSQDIGQVGLAGSVTITSPGQFTVKASGGDIAGVPDQFHFAYVPVTGDCTITARVVSIDNNHVFAKGGVMLRESLAADSAYAFSYNRGNQLNSGYQFRTLNGGAYSNNDSGPAHRWVRVTRVGNTFTTYVSANGTSWTASSSRMIAMPVTIYAGLALTSHDNAKLNTTIFDNVTGLGLLPAQAPRNLAASVRLADAGVTLSWEAVPGSIGYRVKRAAATGGPYSVVADSINAVRYAASGLTAGQRYYHVVSAVTGVGESANSTEVEVEVPAVADNTPVPTGVSAIAGSGQVRVSWSGSAVASSFSVKRGASFAGPFTTVGSPATESYIDTGLTVGSTCYYVVSASGPFGESADSAPVAATPSYAGKAGAIRAMINGRFVSAVGTNPLIADKQIIGSTEAFELLDIGSGHTAIRSLASGLYVSATSAGTGRLVASATSIGTWERYIVSYSDSVTFNFKAVGNDRYVAADGAGSSPLIANRTGAGAYETFSFFPLPVPAVPVGISASPGDSKVALIWLPVASATGYVVKRADSVDGVFVQIGTYTGTSFIDASVSNGRTYHYTISSVNGALASAASDAVSATPAVPPPAPPTGLVAQAISETQVVLTWINRADTAWAYVVERSPAGAGNWTVLSEVLSAETEVYTDHSASASGSYDFRVRCTGPGGVSGYVVKSITLPSGIADGIPGSWRVQYFGNGLTLTADSELLADPDGDGMNNRAEYLAGTNPVDADSVLRVQSIAAENSSFTLTFPSITGKNYAIEKTATLGDASSWVVVRDAIPGTGGLIKLTDDSPLLTGSRFYRVRVK
jgi:sialate O-acetylesterase